MSIQRDVGRNIDARMHTCASVGSDDTGPPREPADADSFNVGEDVISSPCSGSAEVEAA